MVNWKNKDKAFDPDDLKGYDEFTPGSICDTHEMIECRCSGDGVVHDENNYFETCEKENQHDKVDDGDMEGSDDIDEAYDIEEIPEDIKHTVSFYTYIFAIQYFLF